MIACGSEPSERSIFQREWWLDAVAGAGWDKVSVDHAPDCRAWLPVFRYRRVGCQMIGMPPLTSVLGPVVVLPPDAMKRRQLMREVIAQLPPYTRFSQVFPDHPEDAFVFALNGFDIAVQHTQTLAPAFDEHHAWNRLSSKTRNKVRKGLGSFEVDLNVPAEAFYAFLDNNLARLGRRNKLTRAVFMRAAAAAGSRDAMACFWAMTPDRRPAAGITVVWDERRLYYLLSTRDPDRANNAAVSLLIWEAILLASRKGLILDFDSFGTRGAAAFISAFGGKVEARYIVSGFSSVGRVLTSAQQLWRALASAPGPATATAPEAP